MDEPIYVYIFEDGAITKSFAAPTKVDLKCIAQGILEVLVIQMERDWRLDVEYINAEGHRGNVPCGEFRSDHENGSYHSP